MPVLGAMICHNPKDEDWYHACGFAGLMPITSTHWKRSHGNTWLAYEGGPDDAPGNLICDGCVKREVDPNNPGCIYESGCFNGCLCKVG